MRTNYSRIAAVVMAISAGGLAAFALRPAAGTGTLALAARNPAVEVRTQVIRRTIHVIRHEPGARLRGSRGSPALVVAAHGRARTAASGRHRSGPTAGSTAAAAVATRTSGAHAVVTHQSSPSAAPVATRTSGAHSTGSSSAPVRSSAPASQSHPVSTRSSGSHASPSTGTSTHPVTRSSGGGHGHGEDGGDGGGRDD